MANFVTIDQGCQKLVFQRPRKMATGFSKLTEHPVALARFARITVLNPI